MIIKITDLKEIFPYSFIDYEGRRRANVLLHGRHKAGTIATDIEKYLGFGQHGSIIINKLMYDPKQGLTGFVLEAASTIPGFLPTIDVADIEELNKERERIQYEEDAIADGQEKSFTDKMNSFLNL